MVSNEDVGANLYICGSNGEVNIYAIDYFSGNLTLNPYGNATIPGSLFQV